jgi:hypothetical protein
LLKSRNTARAPFDLPGAGGHTARWDEAVSRATRARYRWPRSGSPEFVPYTFGTRTPSAHLDGDSSPGDDDTVPHINNDNNVPHNGPAADAHTYSDPDADAHAVTAP